MGLRAGSKALPLRSLFCLWPDTDQQRGAADSRHRPSITYPVPGPRTGSRNIFCELGSADLRLILAHKWDYIFTGEGLLTVSVDDYYIWILIASSVLCLGLIIWTRRFLTRWKTP